MIEHPKFNYTARDISVETRTAFVLKTNITELASIPGIKDKTVEILTALIRSLQLINLLESS